MTVTQLGDPTVFNLANADDIDDPTKDGVARPILLVTKTVPDQDNPNRLGNGQVGAMPYVGTFIYNAQSIDPPMPTKQGGFSGFASLINPPAGQIYDLAIPPIPIRGIMYPQFVRTIDNG